MKINISGINSVSNDICNNIDTNKSLFICEWNDGVHESFNLFVTHMTAYGNEIKRVVKSIISIDSELDITKNASNYSSKISSIDSKVRGINL